MESNGVPMENFTFISPWKFHVVWNRNRCSTGSPENRLLTGYLADTHTGVGLAVARKFHSYTDSETPTVVCATAHYAKCLGEVVHAVSDPQPSVGKCAAAGGSLPEMLSVLEQRTKPDTRPAMHSRLRSLLECRLPPTLTVLPAQLDAIAAHIRSLLWSSATPRSPDWNCQWGPSGGRGP